MRESKSLYTKAFNLVPLDKKILSGKKPSGEKNKPRAPWELKTKRKEKKQRKKCRKKDSVDLSSIPM